MSKAIFQNLSGTVSKGLMSSGNSMLVPLVQFEGFYEAIIYYNHNKGEWEIYQTNGGFTAGLDIGYKWNFNTFVGPVPVTASFKLGGSAVVDFQTIPRYFEINGYPWAEEVKEKSSVVNDYLSTLRLNAYINAVAGLGLDYAVVALKIGCFGEIRVDNKNMFLTRKYLANTSERDKNGHSIELIGQVGIKFEALFVFIGYEAVLASASAGYRWKFAEFD
jgi:hypothetical protein